MSIVGAMASVLAGVQGIQEVMDNTLDVPEHLPAVNLDVVREAYHEPLEMGPGPAAMQQVVEVLVAVDVPRGRNQAGPARDQVLQLARKCRAALESDPSLGGACQGLTVGPAQVFYGSRAGASVAVARFEVTALYEEE